MRILVFIVVLLSFFSCKKNDPAFEEAPNYPEDVGNIITTKCAISGCHNNKSFQNANELNLTTWGHLFEGGKSGSSAIPYAPNQSSFLQFVNTYSDLGLKASPTMPLNAPVLSRTEVLILKNWILHGCPNAAGDIPFASNATSRKKVYISNQGCDIVSVVDAETKLVMRYVHVGKDPNQIETPHCIRVSSDRKFWYVCFINGTIFQKYDATADTLVSTLEIGSGLWNIIKLTPDGSHAYISDLSNNGRLVYIDLNSMSLVSSIQGSGLLVYPHGIAYTKSLDTIYTNSQYGNTVYRIIPKLFQIDNLSIEKGVAANNNQGFIDPHEIMMSPDFKQYFLTCQSSNEVRVMDAHADTLVKVIHVGKWAQEFAISEHKNQLFVVCSEDPNPVYTGFKGSVYVIDLNSLEIVKVLYEKFYQPHGISVDNDKDLLYVVSRNADPTGPAPHHISECGSRNGYFQVIDINTWKVVKTASEISVDPYSCDLR